jgi:FkbM family methyltransferase
MKHHPVFESFQPVKSVGTGRHVFDFIGSATDVTYRKGWAQHAIKSGSVRTPTYPPLNEHYFDWIATLQSVNDASRTFRMAELGAGWAPWLVRAALAARQRPKIERIELVAVEADETHYGWVQSHFAGNGLRPGDFHLLRGAVGATTGTVRFPKIANPDENYGASTRSVTSNVDYVEVPSYTIGDVLSRLSGVVDFMHVDIQGAEYDALPPAMEELERRVKAVMIGTHISGERHEGLARGFIERGWIEVMNFGRNTACHTEFGDVTFDDGFLFFRNPAL